MDQISQIITKRGLAEEANRQLRAYAQAGENPPRL